MLAEQQEEVGLEVWMDSLVSRRVRRHHPLGRITRRGLPDSRDERRRRLLLHRLPNDAAKADVARRGVDRLALAGGRAIAQAVVRRAQMRAALDHLAREALAVRL